MTDFSLGRENICKEQSRTKRINDLYSELLIHMRETTQNINSKHSHLYIIYFPLYLEELIKHTCKNITSKLKRA